MNSRDFPMSPVSYRLLIIMCAWFFIRVDSSCLYRISKLSQDLCWSPDSQRLACCGGDSCSAQSSACVIAWDTGSRIGEVIGHRKGVGAIAFRPEKPFRVATGGDDFLLAWHEVRKMKLFI